MLAHLKTQVQPLMESAILQWRKEQKMNSVCWRQELPFVETCAHHLWRRLVLTDRFARFLKPLKYCTLLEHITDTSCLTRRGGKIAFFSKRMAKPDQNVVWSWLQYSYTRKQDTLDWQQWQLQIFRPSVQYTFQTSQCTWNHRNHLKFIALHTEQCSFFLQNEVNCKALQMFAAKFSFWTINEQCLSMIW